MIYSMVRIKGYAYILYYFLEFQELQFNAKLLLFFYFFNVISLTTIKKNAVRDVYFFCINCSVYLSLSQKQKSIMFHSIMN